MSWHTKRPQHSRVCDNGGNTQYSLANTSVAARKVFLIMQNLLSTVPIEADSPQGTTRLTPQGLIRSHSSFSGFFSGSPQFSERFVFGAYLIIKYQPLSQYIVLASHIIDSCTSSCGVALPRNRRKTRASVISILVHVGFYGTLIFSNSSRAWCACGFQYETSHSITTLLTNDPRRVIVGIKHFDRCCISGILVLRVISFSSDGLITTN